MEGVCPIKGCDFRAEGETKEEVISKMTEHAKTKHGMKELPPEVMKMIQWSDIKAKYPGGPG